MNDFGIITEIYKILHSHFDIDIDSEVENADDLSFFGHKIRMRGRDMVYLVYIIEQRFGICFTEDDIDNETLYTVKGLSNILNRKLRNND